MRGGAEWLAGLSQTSSPRLARANRPRLFFNSLGRLVKSMPARPANPKWISPSEGSMTWKTPKIVEVAVGLEINMYACASLKR